MSKLVLRHFPTGVAMLIAAGTVSHAIAAQSVFQEYIGPSANGQFGANVLKLSLPGSSGLDQFIVTAPGTGNSAGNTANLSLYSSSAGSWANPLPQVVSFPATNNQLGFGTGLDCAFVNNGPGGPNGVVGYAGNPSFTNGSAGMEEGGVHYVEFLLGGGTPTPVLVDSGTNFQDRMGWSVVRGLFGPVNGTATAYVVSIPSGLSGAGRLRFYSDTNAQLLTTFAPPGAAGGRFGLSMAKLPDLDGDGFNELLVGAPDAQPFGAAYLYMSSNLTAPSQTFLGQAPGTPFGYTVGLAGNVDGDGIPDFWISDRNSDSIKGSVALYRGSDFSLIRRYIGGPGDISGEGNFGSVVAGNGDVNDDGYDDLVVNSFTNSSSLVNIFSGFDGSLLLDIPRDAGSNFEATSALALAELDQSIPGRELILGQAGYDDPVFGAASGRVLLFNLFGAGATDSICTPCLDGAGRARTFGSPVIANNNFSVKMLDVEPFKTGYFLISQVPHSVLPPDTLSYLCIQHPIKRLIGPGQIANSGAEGIISVPIDFMDTDTTGTVQLLAGSTWYFQGWHRMTVPSASIIGQCFDCTVNNAPCHFTAGETKSAFTDAIIVTFQ